MNIELECEQLLNQQRRDTLVKSIISKSKMKKIAEEILLMFLKSVQCVTKFSEDDLIYKIKKILDEKCLIKEREDYRAIVNSIVNVIRKNFPNANVEHEILECEEDAVFINVDRKTYYTNEYSIFIMNLQIEILWKNNYNNIYFGVIE